MKLLILLVLLGCLQGTCLLHLTPLRPIKSCSANCACRLATTKVSASSLFGEFQKQAADILPENADNETKSTVAFLLMKSEFESEKKLMEFESEKKFMKSDHEHDKQKIEDKLRQSTAYYSKQLSAVVQRLVVRIVNLFVLVCFPPLTTSFYCVIFFVLS